VNIDRTRPTVDITTAPGPVLQARDGKLRGVAFDALSGVRLVRVTYTSTNGKQVVQKDSDSLTCGTTGHCTWSAPLLGKGPWRANARSVDFAGNTSAVDEGKAISLTVR
jgi:hypothetical protein